MNNNDTNNLKEVRKQNYEANRMNSSKNSKKKINKDLPWWVELLFVQIGLPDKLLIKILNTKRKSKELIKEEKNTLLTLLFVIISFLYFYPVIKQAKNILDCESAAKNYISKNKNIKSLSKIELKMVSTNFCYGGEEIYEIKK